jgi:uncharacterized protein YyaL (SSP411 family)
MTTNRLGSETSPYLRQHAHNPVDWFPWGPEALGRARSLGKPILLSIGYSACHWCHVMAHESFEDPATAALMNELFVNIKVDREERPDLDRIYQLAHQMLTQRGGGWPLTMFLSHEDQRPFFGGTYFPKEQRYGMPPFSEVLRRVAEYYRTRPDDVRAQNAALLDAFAQLSATAPAAEGTLDAAPLAQCRRELEGSFDSEFGGFGAAPKFPHATMLERLLRDWHAAANSLEPDLQALYMATLTLTRMAEGGLCDQLGGGFARYSVDAWWMIPHFEKMLYDNGALLAVYADAALATGEPLYANVAAATAQWIMRDMQAPAGGYYSSLDADSEGHEGRFYVWQPEQVRALLDEAEYAVFAPRYGLDREPNFEGEAWHLHAFQSVDDVAAAAGLTSAAASALLDSARAKLLEVRRARVWPGRDEKVLTSWNALMIRGMARAARALGRDDLGESAQRALDFLRAELWRDGRLLATHKDGRSHLAAYLDDHVLLVDAILELLQWRWRSADLGFARELLELVLAHFEDAAAGGFWFTADDHEALIHRSRSFADDATPSGNGIAVFVLQRMGYLLGEPRYLAAAERALRAGWGQYARHPSSHTSMLTALDEWLHPPETVILRGAGPQIGEWQRDIARLYAPRRMIFAIPADAQELPAALSDKAALGGPVAYVCRGSTCAAPLTELPALVQALRFSAD